MDFFLVGILFWSLVLVSPVLIIYGLFKKSWKAIFFSGLTSLPIVLYLGVGGELRFTLIVPVVLFVVSYLYFKKYRSTQ